MARKAGRTFSSLRGEARQRALKWGRERAREWIDADMLTEELQGYAAEKHGLKADKCAFSLGYCQGDGVAFYGAFNLSTLAEKHPELDAALVAFTLAYPDGYLQAWIEGGDSRYCHCNSMDAKIEAADCDTNQDAADVTAAWMQDYVDELLKDISRDVAKVGYAEIEYQESDEAIIETFEANEYRFTQEGDYIT